jgi:hypothetical protein
MTRMFAGRPLRCRYRLFRRGSPSWSAAFRLAPVERYSETRSGSQSRWMATGCRSIYVPLPTQLA